MEYETSRQVKLSFIFVIILVKLKTNKHREILQKCNVKLLHWHANKQYLRSSFTLKYFLLLLQDMIPEPHYVTERC